MESWGRRRKTAQATRSQIVLACAELPPSVVGLLSSVPMPPVERSRAGNSPWARSHPLVHQDPSRMSGMPSPFARPGETLQSAQHPVSQHSILRSRLGALQPCRYPLLDQRPSVRLLDDHVIESAVKGSEVRGAPAGVVLLGAESGICSGSAPLAATVRQALTRAGDTHTDEPQPRSTQAGVRQLSRFGRRSLYSSRTRYHTKDAVDHRYPLR